MRPTTCVCVCLPACWNTNCDSGNNGSRRRLYFSCPSTTRGRVLRNSTIGFGISYNANSRYFLSWLMFIMLHTNFFIYCMLLFIISQSILAVQPPISNESFDCKSMQLKMKPDYNKLIILESRMERINEKTHDLANKMMVKSQEMTSKMRTLTITTSITLGSIIGILAIARPTLLLASFIVTLAWIFPKRFADPILLQELRLPLFEKSTMNGYSYVARSVEKMEYRVENLSNELKKKLHPLGNNIWALSLAYNFVFGTVAALYIIQSPQVLILAPFILVLLVTFPSTSMSPLPRAAKYRSCLESPNYNNNHDLNQYIHDKIGQTIDEMDDRVASLSDQVQYVAEQINTKITIVEYKCMGTVGSIVATVVTAIRQLRRR
jgi:hypothetical protein